VITDCEHTLKLIVNLANTYQVFYDRLLKCAKFTDDIFYSINDAIKLGKKKTTEISQRQQKYKVPRLSSAGF